MIRQEDLTANLYTTSVESNLLLTNRITYDSNGNAQYLGVAAPGLAEDSSGWMIRKIIYDGRQRPTAILFAEGEANFNKIWQDYANYSYR